MYPRRELIQLDTHKTALRNRIAQRRRAGAADLARVIQPVAGLDQLRSLWRQASPLFFVALIPLGLLIHRSVARHTRELRTVLRWAPLFSGVLRGVAATLRRPT